MSFPERVREATPILLDGGLATQLEAQGCDLSGALWSAGLLTDRPDEVRRAHEAFLEAGAEVVTTASYQASARGFAAAGIPRDEADDLLRRSVELARVACNEHAARTGGKAWVAASVGPWGATCCDGSEYTGAYAIDRAALHDFHAERLAVLDAAGADVLACETIPNHDEASVLAELLIGCQTPSWVSFCCRDGAHLSDGTPIEQAAEPFIDHPTVLAVGVNCVAPEFVAPLLERLRRALPETPLVAYPNSGEGWDATERSWTGARTELGGLIHSWIGRGAHLIGGCCRVTPAQLRAMAREIGGGAAVGKPSTRQGPTPPPG